MKDTICIYHGNCADGFTAAWAVYKSLGPDIEYFPGIYGKSPPDVKGKDVIMVDFSYKRPILDVMAKDCKTMVILDHHKTAAEDLVGIPQPIGRYGLYENPDVCALFDMDRSGAGIAWDYFHPGVPRPPLVDYVEDRDLWKFKMEASREVNAYIFAHEYTFQDWDILAEEIHNRIAVAVTGGRAIERKHHKDVEELVRVCKRRMKIAEWEVWGASIPYTMTSDAGHLMAKDGLFAACYWDTPDGRVFSLRSHSAGADVSAIAKHYGGGGHRNAAGFTVPMSEIGQFEL